ncbi:MAG: LCP family protein [Alphaproteobacteria bacterium]|nr:LCP family protein [Alphaproteobacteria bacterium]
MATYKRSVTGVKRRPQGKYSGRKKDMNEIKHKQQKGTLFAKFFVMFIFISVAAVIGMFYYALKSDFCEQHFGLNSPVTKFFKQMASDNSKKANAEFSLPFGHRRKNILLLGVDASENPDDLWTGTRTDTIIIINIDPRTKSVNAISIPRDSKVYLPNHNGIQKINAAHAIGGVNMTVKTIENTLGINIDRYIMVHDNAVKNIVDALGGVDVYVEKNMYYNDYAGKLHINLSKGYQHLSADEAIGYLRFRHDPLGDIGRTQRQQWFLRGLVDTLKKPETISKLPEVVSSSRKYIKTDMSLYELTQFAMMAKHIDMDKVEIATLPGAPNKRGYISYWILDPDKTQEVVNRLIYRRSYSREFEDAPTASVVYTDSESAEAAKITEALKNYGVNVTCESRISKTHSQFIAHNKKVTNEYFNNLKKDVSGLAGYQFVYEPVIYMCGETDFTVVVAGK